MLSPPTFTVTSFFGLISFSGLVTVLVLSRLSFVTCVAVFSTVSALFCLLAYFAVYQRFSF